jgi:hypothetical protein
MGMSRTIAVVAWYSKTGWDRKSDWKSIDPTQALCDELERKRELEMTYETQVYLGDLLPTILMKVRDDETLSAAVVRFEEMYVLHPSARPFEIYRNTSSDFGNVSVHTFDTASSPISYMVHDLYVDGSEVLSNVHTYM